MLSLKLQEKYQYSTKTGQYKCRKRGADRAIFTSETNSIMKKAIQKMAAGETIIPAATSSQTGTQYSTIKHHGKTPCKNLNASGYCNVCKRQCPSFNITTTFNQL
jgi:hypothetical protein